MNQCWLCTNPLEGGHRTGEHIIPSAIGGRDEVHDFICRECNSKRGAAWEAELARQFLWFSSASGVKRGRGGAHPDFSVQTASGKRLKLRDDSVLVLDGHDISIEELDGRIKIAIEANDPKTIRNLLKKVTADYPGVDFEKAITRSETTYLDEPLCMNFRYGGPNAGRSMVKSSLALLSKVSSVDKSNCGRALAYLLDPSPDAPLPYGLFFDVDLVLNRPKDHLFHCVSVIGQPHEGRILGYVELFNFARILVIIGDEYAGPAFQETYSIDPVEGKTLDLIVDFGLIGSRPEDFLKMASEPPEMYRDSLQHTGNLVRAIHDARVTKAAILKASEDASKALGLQSSSEDVPSELSERWIHLFLQNLKPHIEAKIKSVVCVGE